MSKAYKSVIQICKEKSLTLRRWLEAYGTEYEDLGFKSGIVLERLEVTFENGYKATISVCSGYVNCFIDAVLLDQYENQLCVLDCDSDILGEYEFEVHGDTFIVDIQEDKN